MKRTCAPANSICEEGPVCSLKRTPLDQPFSWGNSKVTA